MARVGRLAAAFVAAVSLMGTAAASAQDWPSRPIRMLVGFPPGQATDVVARLLAQQLSAANGWNVVVENKPGQGGSIGAATAAKAEPDGYTLLLSATAPLATNQNLYKSISYDSRRDFAPITLVGNLPFVLVVNTTVPANSVSELVALAKAKPNDIAYATPGSGTTAHLITAMFARAAGIELMHVPYKGTGESLTDLVAGRIPMMFDTALFLAPHAKGGKVRALAVTTLNRSALLPEVPTLAESGFSGFNVSAWLGMVAPAGTPQPIVQRLNKDLVAILRTPEVAQKMATLGAEVLTSTPEEFGAFLRSEVDKWGQAVRETGVQID
jgi:tripartite-type tricarboxylate transporter receptor subunit TctC